MKIISIPVIDDIDRISSVELDTLRKTGIFYVKIDDETDDHALKLREKALDFFRSDDQVKRLHAPTTPNITQTEKRLSYGYNDRRATSGYIETFRQKIGEATEPALIGYTTTINCLSKALVDEIGIKLLRRMFQSLSLNKESDASIDAMLSNAGAFLSLVYYPAHSPFDTMNNKPRLGPHKDIDWITVLLIEKPGLKFWADGRWLDVFPKKGYAVAMMGYDISEITKGQIRSCLHTVKLPEITERLSVLFFISSTRLVPFPSMNGDVLCDCKQLTAQERYQKHNVETELNAKSALSNFRIGINISYMIAASLYAVKSWKFDTIKPSSFMAFNFVSLFSLNGVLEIFKNTHFENRMLIDHLQYPDTPTHAAESEIKAYELGKSSLSLFGMARSFLDSRTYTHSSFWNAGFMRSFSEKCSSKKDETTTQCNRM